MDDLFSSPNLKKFTNSFTAVSWGNNSVVDVNCIEYSTASVESLCDLMNFFVIRWKDTNRLVTRDDLKRVLDGNEIHVHVQEREREMQEYVSYKLPILYKLQENKMRVWQVSTRYYNDGTCSLVSKYGQLDGKQICSERSTVGKNLKSKNATTPITQAMSEAKSKYNKKVDLEKYTRTLPTSETLPGCPSPMLAQDYSKHSKKIKFPCFTQPKLDGYRAVYYNNRLFTRKGLPFNKTVTQHILDELSTLPETIFDGELFADNNSFSDLGVLRKKSPSVDDISRAKNIKYHIYDTIPKSLDPFVTRNETLKSIFEKRELKYLKLVPTMSVNSDDEIKKQHIKYIQINEGTIIRNGAGVYSNKRSFDLQKYKDFQDAEFEIVSFTQDQTGGVLWTCKTDFGKTFNVSNIGTRQASRALVSTAGEYIGKMLWVKFFEYTPDGIPRFPKGMRPGIESIRLEQL